MRANATVVEIKDGNRAVVRTERKSACAQCHKNASSSCSVCDLFIGDDKFTAVAQNCINAKIGDEVVVETPSKNVIANAFFLFVLPIVIGIAVYIVYFNFSSSEVISTLAAIIGFVITFSAVAIISKIILKDSTNIEIIEIVKSKD